MDSTSTPMSGKPKLYLLDACVLIKLHELGLWRAVLAKSEVVLGRTIATTESRYFKLSDGTSWGIDLEPDIASGRVTVLTLEGASLDAVRDRFDPVMAERVDSGELEALSLLAAWDPELPCPPFCTADQMAAVAACLLGLAKTLTSLEAVLQTLGIARPAGLPRHFTESRLKEWVRRGVQDRLVGTGLR